MGFNAALADKLDRLASILELTGANRFRVNALARAARIIERHPSDLSQMDASELIQIEGIGKGIAEKIREFAGSGRIGELDEALDAVPSGLLQLLDIQGLGPKKVRLLWQELGVTDTASLERSLDDGSAASLPGMGEKTVANIRKAMAFASKSTARLPLGIAWPVAMRVVEVMRSVPGVTQAEAAGSLRRGRDTIGDLDILVSAKDPEAVREAFCTMPGVQEVLARGETKCAVRVEVRSDAGRWNAGSDANDGTIGVDLRIVPAGSFGAALMYFTGSKEHNVRLRERAQQKGLTLNEYGLFPEDGEDTPPQSRGVRPVAAKTERAVYTKLGLPHLPPECREDIGELSWTSEPDLISVEDIRSELHAHTTASDGRLELGDLVEAAIARDFHTIAVTDHSRSSAQAGGLTIERLRAQRDEIERARERFGTKIQILCGSEVDILADGSLDYPDEVLAELDIVVASPHAALTQDPKTATDRLLRAIRHPMVHILGHPTGRLVNRRAGLEPAMDELIAAAVEHDVALEVNSHWMRLDLRDRHVRAATAAGAKIAIDCDVHAEDDFDNLRYGVMTARRGGLPPAMCVNTWESEQLSAWLRSKR
ncbi:MAG: DNA polymerase/3'-5' exonuclease PolX [Phycisphaerales bacterium]